MAYPTDRIVLYDKDGAPLGDLAPMEVYGRVRVEEINAEHELALTTTRVLAVGTRVLTVDATGKRREYAVYKPDERHDQGENAVGTYRCMWSLQYDLMSTFAEEKAEPGMGSGCSASAAVQAALDGCKRWTVGTVDVGSVAAGKGAVMIGISAWERLKLVVEHWGGEVDAEIGVDASGIVSRRVALRAHLGTSTATRRFDWAKDLTSIARMPDEGPYYCRVVPLGRGQREYAEDDETEFEWPSDISEEMSDGRVYIQDDEAALAFRTLDPDGSWHYPTKVVHYDESDPELLLAAAQEDLHNHTRPSVSYEATVLQLAEAGMDAQGVTLGDEVQCVDHGFNAAHPLHVGARVVRMEVDELAPEEETKLTLGNVGGSLSRALIRLVGASTRDIATKVRRIEQGGTIAYVEELLERLNAEMNARGGHTYVVSGEGSITYDVAVSDPLVGTEASYVTQMKGGLLRFSKTKKPGFAGINDWAWSNVITPDGYLGLAATIGRLTTGYIGSETGENYWDLSGDAVRIAASSKIGGKTVAEIAHEKSEAELQGWLNDTYKTDKKSLQDQIDGKIETWSQPADPSTSWTTDALRSAHAGDLWHRTTDNTTWRWSGTAWAEQAAPDAVFDKIDGKAQVFMSTPVVPYHKGDLWFDSATSDIMTCVTTRTTGSYKASDWEKRNRYTDDSAVDALDEKRTQAEVLSRLTGGYTTEGLYIQNGHLYLNASFIATGSLSGFKIASSAIYSGTSLESTAAGAVALTTSNFTRAINATSRENLRLAIGSRFGVARDGTLYASNVNIAGKITSTSGKIGGFQITSTQIYNNSVNLSQSGLRFTYSDNDDGIIVLDQIYDIGKVGVANPTGYKSMKGLAFDLGYDGYYMAWASKTTSSGAYTWQLVYVNKDMEVGSNIYQKDTLYALCHLQVKRDLTINGALYVISTSSGLTVSARGKTGTYSIGGKTLEFVEGVLVAVS